ncbi:MAG: hypothetical protein QF489_01810 [Planctomycetota bacterium]|nr:hypothetical protein [Planctomycetota bacterium]
MQEEVTAGDWMLVGAFDHPEGHAIGSKHGPEDFIKKMKVGKTWPGLERDFQNDDGALVWKKVQGTNPRGKTAVDSGKFDLWGLCGKTGKTAAYLYLPLTATKELQVPIMFGSDDGCVMWLNGEQVFAKGVARGISPFDDQLTLKLQEGLNHLLVKVTNAGGAWAFEMQAPRGVEQAKINNAVDRGVEHLLSLQLIDGSWGQERGRYRNGSTALALYALLSSGISPKHPAILRGLEYISCVPSDMTYSASCELMALAALNDPDYLEWIEERAEDLISWQENNGQWAYPGGHADMSCTQFAVMGLRAAAEAGVEIPAKVWYDAVDGAMLAQEKVKRSATIVPAGFAYYQGHSTGITGSMTTAGLTVLAVAREQLGENIQKKYRIRIDRAISQGMAWMAREFVVKSNPNKSYNWVYYWLYGVERVGSYLKISTIGDHDWYQKGALQLISKQGNKGQWVDPWGGRKCTSTSFSLLFLKKASARATTGGSVVNKKKNELHFSLPEDGELKLHVLASSPMTMWVTPPENRLPDAVEYFVREVGEEWDSIGTSTENRYAKQFPTTKSGTYEVRCVGHFEGGATNESGTVRFELKFGVDPKTLSYASDSMRNILPAYRPKISISSNLSSEGGNFLVDNEWKTRWRCEAGDADPWLEIKLKRRAKASRILFSHALTCAWDQTNNPRATKIELWLNNDKEPTVYDINPDPFHKTVIDLPPKTKVNFLKVRIIEVTGGKLGAASVGFSEIELH